MRLTEVLFLCVCMENKLIVYIYAVVCANTMYSDGVTEGSSGSSKTKREVTHLNPSHPPPPLPTQ